MIRPVLSPTTEPSTRMNQDHENDHDATNDSSTGSNNESRSNENNHDDDDEGGELPNVVVAPGVPVDCNTSGTVVDWMTRLTWFLTFVVIVGITTIVVLVWNMHRQSKNDSTSSSTNNNNSNLLPLAQYYHLLSEHLSQVRHVNGLTDPQTDAYKTLEWMAFEDGAIQQLLLPPNHGRVPTLNVPAVEQRVAVAMFFFATAGADFWNTDWLLPGKDECTLDGITCNDQQQITHIVLTQRSLLGTLPSELSWLSHLQRLDVHQNRLYGTLPLAFFTNSSWTDLDYLDISFNSMTGSLPSNWSALSHLSDFAAQLNSFTGPLPLQLPPSLEYFSMDGNRLQGTIPWNQWKQHSMTFMTQNDTNTVHPTEQQSQQQQGFDLKVFDVGANSMIDGIISPYIATLFPHLVSFGLYRTKVHGTLPTQMGQLRHLEELSLAGSKISGTIPSTLYQLSTLEWLVAGSTKLEGTLSTHIAQLSSLQVLNLDNTLITGTLPTELGSMIQLEWLQLAECNLVGTIPTQLGQLSKLSRLWLRDTQLNGSFPSELCQLPAVLDDLRVDCDGGFPISCNCCNYCY